MRTWFNGVKWIGALLEGSSHAAGVTVGKVDLAAVAEGGAARVGVRRHVIGGKAAVRHEHDFSQSSKLRHLPSCAGKLPMQGRKRPPEWAAAGGTEGTRHSASMLRWCSPVASHGPLRVPARPRVNAAAAAGSIADANPKASADSGQRLLELTCSAHRTNTLVTSQS